MDHKVTSEIYDEFDYTSEVKPIVHDDNVVSIFKFKTLPKAPEIDQDGDLIVCRKAKNKEFEIEIEHSKRTELALVGMQMWRGSLLLADWLLNKGESFSKDNFILELAGGTGFTSVVASMFCPVICTDVERGNIFELLESNIKRNKNLVKHPIQLANFNFFNQLIPSCVVENIAKVSIILVAEVIYDNELTDAFIKTLEHLLTVDSTKRDVLLAVEKRFVFTVMDCDSVAPCFDYFLQQLSCSRLEFEELPIDFPQYFDYERVDQLVFCKLTLKN